MKFNMGGRLRDVDVPGLKQGFKIYPEDIAGLIGLPHVGDVYYVDAANGNDNNPGNASDQAFATVSQAHSAATANQHDVVVYIGNASGVSETTLTWSKDFTHLLGVASGAFNSRSRISAGSSATSEWFTFSADGAIVANVRVGTFIDANVNAVLSGDRNAFYNVAFQGGGNATAADDVAMRSLEVQGGSENYFSGCTIGLDTIPRANVASAELEFNTAATRNHFNDCFFTKQADGVGNLFVKTVGTSAVDRWTRFQNCSFYSFWANYADKITGAFDVSSQSATGDFIFSGVTDLVGADDWEATASNRLWFPQIGETAAKLGLSINQTN